MAKPVISSVILSLLLASTAGAAIGCKSSKAAEREKPAAEAPAHVEKADVTEASAPTVLRLTGSLKGMKEADLAANAAGRVTKTFVERGDEIKAGAIVAQLDTSAAGLALKQAAVDVETARTQEAINRADCARFEQLNAKGAISPFEYDQAVAKCKTAPLGLQLSEARQSIAAKNVGDGTIRAPFSGVVSERFVEVGEYVQASSKVVSIADSSDLRLELTIPEANVPSVKSGANVSFTVSAYPDKVFHGTVRHMSGALREKTRDLVAEAVVGNADRLLRPGMFADIAIETGSRPLPTVPMTAVFERQEKKRVFVVKNGRLEERVLQEGPIVDGRLSVEAGVKTGEKVVASNHGSLLNGQAVD